MRCFGSHQQVQPEPPSRLLSLPGEIRNQILRYIVTQPEPIALRRRDAPFTINLNILYTCRQLRDEASEFLYHENTLEIEIDSRGTIASLHFSGYHSICEYRAKEAVVEVSARFLDKFCRLQFRFLDTRRPDSLRKAIKRIQQCFTNKHLTVILPPPKAPRIEAPAATIRPRNYPHINDPLSPLSILRCASLQVFNSDTSQNVTDFNHLIDLVTSNIAPVDMVQQYYNLQRLARAVDRMLVPSATFPRDFELLRTALFDKMRDVCQSANRSDQDTFLLGCKEFEDCYRHIQDLS